MTALPLVRHCGDYEARPPGGFFTPTTSSSPTTRQDDTDHLAEVFPGVTEAAGPGQLDFALRRELYGLFVRSRLDSYTATPEKSGKRLRGSCRSVFASDRRPS